MKLLLSLLLLIGFSLAGFTQEKYVYKILADSVKITNCDSAELIIENHTQAVPGFLFNTGNGRTIFKKAVQKINDSLFLIGADTLNIRQAPSPLKWYQESATPAGLNNYTVTGNYAVAVAGQSNKAYGINSGVFGGAGNIAGGNNSFGIGDNSVVVGGFQNLDSCVDCVAIGGDDNVLHPSAVNAVILGTGHSETYRFNSFIASAGNSMITGPNSANSMGETIIGGAFDTVRSDNGQILGGLYCNSYSFGELVTGLYPTAYTAGSTTSIVPTDRLFNIGNGTSTTARSDAFTVLKNGNTTINGSAFITGKTFLGGTTSPTAVLHLSPGSNAAGTAPLKFTSGSLLASSEPGAVEFLTDKAYLGTTSAGRKEFTLNEMALTGSCIPFVSSAGRLTNTSLFTYDPTYGTELFAIPAYSYRGTGTVPLDDRIGIQLTNLATNGPATSSNPAAPPPGIFYQGSGWSSTNAAAQNVQFATWMQVKGGTTSPSGIYTIASKINGTTLSIIEPYTNLYTLNSSGYANLLRGMFIGDVVTSPTALLHLAAGSATAGTAPLKLTAGTVLSTPENGAVEYDGTNYYADASATRYTLAKTLTTTATLDFPGTGAQSSSDLTVTLNGVAIGDVVAIGPASAAVTGNSCFTAWVSAANTVTIRFNNYSTGTIDPASGSFRVSVIKY